MKPVAACESSFFFLLQYICIHSKLQSVKISCKFDSKFFFHWQYAGAIRLVEVFYFKNIYTRYMYIWLIIKLWSKQDKNLICFIECLYMFWRSFFMCLSFLFFINHGSLPYVHLTQYKESWTVADPGITKTKGRGPGAVKFLRSWNCFDTLCFCSESIE